MNVDEAVKKSLYDKDINSVVYNPNIVINDENKNIKNKVQELLKKSTRVDIAISYVVWSGLSLIYNDLKEFGSDSRLILTIEGSVTDPISLKKLNELKMQIKVYVPYVTKQGFHLKTYMFENGDNRTLLIGSSNISARAFGFAHEMAVEIDAKSKGFIVEEYNNVFNDLWNNDDTQWLTQEFIDGYTKIYHEKKILGNYESTNFINKYEIKPNYMQEKALTALEECRQNNNKGLVIAATGTGKTYLSAFDVRNSNAKKVLFLVHNRLILTSAKNTFEKIFKNKKLTELSSETKDDINKSDFIFTTDKTAQSYLVNNVSKDYFDYIIIDEAHKIGFETQYEKIINYFTPKFILGLTATPERTDNSDFLFKTFDYSVPYEIRLLDAMKNELVCPFTYYGLNLEKPLLESNEEFNYEELAVYLNNLILEKGHYGEKLKCLVFCSNKKEAMKVSVELNKIGYKSDFVVSGNDNKTRENVEELIQKLQSNELGTIEILCTVNMFNEGVDIPDINTIIMLRNTISSIIYIQQLGRGLRRTFDPHKYVTVFDIIGNSKNNYSIAQVLTGNTTVDKRKLYMYAHNNFQTVSPFINVIMEKEAMEKIIKSISNNFTIKTQIKEKYRNELYRYKEIPSLLEMYLNESFNELDLLQLLFKNFYDPFEEYYFKKYSISKGNKFIDNFLTLITQFVFRSYDEKTLSDYVKLLKGERIENDILRRILLPSDFKDGISTAINSEYNKKSKSNPKVFSYKDKYLFINEEIKELLIKNNAIELFNEHIELFEYISKNKVKKMETFDLIDKGEFLYNVGSKDCYMNVVGERIDKEKKTVYCTIKITDKKSFYNNYIIDNDKIIYYTQNSKSKKSAEEKIQMFIKDNYKFYICAQFPHLGYTSTSYFNLGEVKINRVSEIKKTDKGKYNHEIEFQLEKELPDEFLQYKSK